MSPDELRNRFRGCMVGLAIGDALGAACEGMKEYQVRQIHGIVRDYQSTPHFDPGEFTDDTCMALAIAESVIEAESVDVELIADAFVEWMNKDGRGIGLLTLDALRMIQDGESPAEAGMRAWEKSGRSSAGNGAVMRCAPIGLLDYRDPYALVQDTIMVSRITHYDPRCCWTSVAVNAAIAGMLNEVADPLAAAAKVVRGRCEELDTAIADAASEDVQYMTLDRENMGYTVLTTQVALAALRQFASFEDGIIAVVNKGGDADTNAAVAGALLGTNVGYENLPPRWVKGLWERERLLSAADGLYELAMG